MTPLKKVIKEKNTTIKPIWIMRQAGRYLPEFREIRQKNTDFIKLCLNEKLASEITLQPLKRFDLDAAIIFSDILMVPYALSQKVEFKKNIGPILGNINLDTFSKLSEESFKNKNLPIYNAINLVNKHPLTENKSTIGFIGAPWTLLVYMINKQSPKLKLKRDFYENTHFINEILIILEKFLKFHIKNQIESGAEIIQIFDSWAGLVKDEDLEKFIYFPTLKLVEYIKSFDVPAICFPRNIKNYKKYCSTVKPDVICIDYSVNPLEIVKNVEIPVQGGMDPKVLLSTKDNLKNEAKKYLDIFKDHPYIFNLGHGILPETDPSMMEYLVKIVKNF